MKQKFRRRYHRIDGWRGYWIPAKAVAGASDTGSWDDSPAPSSEVAKEVERFRREVLRANGIRSKVVFGATSNVFAGKRWIVVLDGNDFERAAQLTIDWIEEHYGDTQYVHDADLGDLGYLAGADAPLSGDEPGKPDNLTAQ